MKTENIYHKLLEFQKLGISVKKDGKNPHFKSNYSTLNEVLDKVKKPLNDFGILIIFSPEENGLTTTLRHVESETEIKSFIKYINADTPQKVLSCNTYFRRGSLVSLLGLEDEDDDGNLSSQKDEPKNNFVENPIEKIKATKSRAELTELFNKMPVSQQKADHIIEAFKSKSETFKTK